MRAPIRHPARLVVAGLVALLVLVRPAAARAENFEDAMARLAERVAEALSINRLGRDSDVDIYIRPPFDDVYRVVCAPLSRRLAREFRSALPRAFDLKKIQRARVVQRQGQGPGQFILNVSWRDFGEETLEIAFELGDMSSDQIATLSGDTVEIPKADLREDELRCLARLRVINRVETAAEPLYVHRSADVFSAELGVIEPGKRFRLLGRMPYTEGDWAVVKILDGPDDPWAETVGFASVPLTEGEKESIRKQEEAEAARAAAIAEADRRKAEAEDAARRRAEAEDAARRRAEAEEAAKREAEAAEEARRRAEEAARIRAEEEAKAKAREEQRRAEEAAAARRAAEDAERRAREAEERARQAEERAAAEEARRRADELTRRSQPPAVVPIAGQWQCEGQQPVDNMTAVYMNFQLAFNADGTYALQGQATAFATFNNTPTGQMMFAEYGRYASAPQTIQLTPQGSQPPMALAPYVMTITTQSPTALGLFNPATNGQVQCFRTQ